MDVAALILSPHKVTGGCALIDSRSSNSHLSATSRATANVIAQRSAGTSLAKFPRLGAFVGAKTDLLATESASTHNACAAHTHS